MSEIQKDLHSFWHFTHRNRKNLILGAIVIVFSVFSFFITKTDLYMTSIIMIKTSAPFDGTTMPIAETPNWNLITREQRGFEKNTLPPDIFMPIPRYSTSRLGLDWSILTNSAEHKAIRNEKITYTIPYLGTYKMDYKENTGGHPGIDIIVPPGSEIYAIANAIVYQSSQTSGAGNYVVLRHDNVPDPKNPGSFTTLYSVYEHLGERLVNKGDTIAKGQLIALSGNTGNSTAPHLHFQIDLVTAPFHPYWPYNFNDPADSRSKTIHPINYVYKYENYSPNLIVSSENIVSDTANENQIENTTTPKPETAQPEIETEIIPQKLPDARVTSFKFTGENSIKQDSQSLLVISAIDKNGKTITDYQDKENVELTLSGAGNISKTTLTSTDFNSGIAEVIFTPNSAGESTITATNGLASGKTRIKVISEIAQTTSFAIKVADTTTLELGVPTKIKIHALDSNKNTVNTTSFPGNAIITITPDAALSRRTLTASDFENGIADITISPTTKDNLKLRIQAGVLFGTRDFQIITSTSPFSDVLKTHKNYPAIKFLRDQNIINGYDDGTFRPNKTVSRSELLKIILLGSKTQVNPVGIANFNDVSKTAWYTSYISQAYNLGIVKGYSDGTFQPSKVVSRIEALKIILETMKVNFSNSSTTSYGDTPAGQWFSKYAAYSKENNLIDVQNNALLPSQEMTRAEVAEIMYRLMN